MKNIILTGGGTAGHCMPHLAILPKLKSNFDNVYYIGSINGIEKDIIKKVNIPYYPIETTKLIRKLTLKNFNIPFKFIKGYSQAKELIKELNPSIIFSKGGYVALPVVLAGHKLGVPVISHESDYTIGLANKLSAKKSKYLLTSFEDTAKKVKNGLCVGSPIREELFLATRKDGLNEFKFSGFKPILLVLGGSLGCKLFNDFDFENIDKLLLKFDVLHIVGKGNINKTINLNGYAQKEFVFDVKKAFAVADVCLSRAGSNSVFELLALEKPTLFVPLSKKVSRGDQILNANYFYNKVVCDRIYEEEFTFDKAFDRLVLLEKNKAEYKKRMKSLNLSSANDKIIKLLIENA